MSEIKITVQGPVGSGKSALLGEIEILCKALGVPVRYADPSDAASEKSMTHADWTAYLEMYKPSVVLHEKGPDRAALASAPVAELRLEWSAKALYDAIKDVLLNHRLSNLVDEDGEFFPLVDHLCSQDDKTTESGEFEIALICDAIYNDVLTKSAPVADERAAETFAERFALALKPVAYTTKRGAVYRGKSTQVGSENLCTISQAVYEFRAALASLPAPDERQAVAYLDLGTGGYMDMGTDLTDEQLAALPKGRHMLAIIGSHGVNGYSPCALASAPVAGEAKNYPGENVAERLDNMADDQPPGSQAQSDLYAAATIWRKHIAHRAAPQASEAVRTQVLAALESAQRFIRNGIEFGYIRMPDADTPDPAHRTPGLIDAAIRSLKSQADKDGGQERAGDARSALTWYAEQVAGCRKLGPDGDAARNALDTDGGQRARAALSATQAEQSEAPYWLCCGSKDPAHPGRQAPDCFDPERAKWGTRSQHATQAEQGERDA